MTKEKTTIRKTHIRNDIFIPHIEQILKEGKHKSVTFVVRGYSMRPFLEHDRDKVELVSPLPPCIGQVVLAEIAPKRYALHRIIKIESNKITMQGDGNALSLTETFTTDKIIGTAIAFIRKGERITTDSAKWRRYSAAWKFLRPIRRILLGLHRRIIKIIKI